MIPPLPLKLDQIRFDKPESSCQSTSAWLRSGLFHFVLETLGSTFPQNKSIISDANWMILTVRICLTAKLFDLNTVGGRKF